MPSASISVMLALVLFLLLSLILVTLESARVSAMRAMVTLNLNSSLEAVLSDYYEPLFDDYGIYGLYGIDPEAELKSYLAAAASPLDALPELYLGQRNSGYVYSYEIQNVEISNKTHLLDGGGAIVTAQMMEAGALDGMEMIAEELLDALKLLDSAEETKELLQEKIAVEQQLAYMDSELLALMQTVDGAPVDSGGFVVDANGDLVCGKRFAKRLVPGAVSKETVMLEHGGIYAALRDRYVDGKLLLTEMQALGERVGSEDGALEKLKEKEVELRLLLLSCRETTEQALGTLETLISYQEQVKPMVSEWERALAGGKALLGDTQYAAYLEELETMKKYAGMTLDTSAYDFPAMQQTLRQNLSCLLRMEESYVNYEKAGRSEWQSRMEMVQRIFRDYSFAALRLDYSGIQGITIQTENSGWEELCEFLLNGMDSYLFTGEEELSRRSIVDAELPSKSILGDAQELYRLPRLTKEDLKDTAFIQNYLEGEAVDGICGFLSETAEQIGEKLLLLSYMNARFGNYTEQKQGALFYQQEYLIFGSMRDITNVRQAAYSILGIRLLMNLLHAFTNPAMTAQATAYATELVGGLGMPFLIAVCEYVILFVCGVQNALLETIELLQGKAVPFLVSASSFQIRMEEIFSMGKSGLHARAAAYTGGAGFCLTYSHYLLLFLLPVSREHLTYRAMDLIQENIQLYYEPAFQLSQCIHSFGAAVTVRFPSRYAGIGFSENDAWGVREISIREEAAVGY